MEPEWNLRGTLMEPGGRFGWKVEAAWVELGTDQVEMGPPDWTALLQCWLDWTALSQARGIWVEPVWNLRGTCVEPAWNLGGT